MKNQLRMMRKGNSEGRRENGDGSKLYSPVLSEVLQASQLVNARLR